MGYSNNIDPIEELDVDDVGEVNDEFIPDGEEVDVEPSEEDLIDEDLIDDEELEKLEDIE
jgi:hypothetical protein